MAAELVRAFRVSLAISVAGVVLATVLGGPHVGAVVAILAVLEISLSFDNAVVNARVLERMDPKWQRLFLTVGIVIAVFGMRLVFPLLVVGLAGHLGPGTVVDLALHHPQEYAEKLESAHPAISAFGGVFLLMIFLDFLMEERDDTWLRRVETALASVGRLKQLSSVVGLCLLLVASQTFARDDSGQVLVAGVAGLVTYLLVKGASDLFALQSDVTDDSGALDAAAVARAGLASFVYLQVLDASFSFDGVIGAFAITDKIFEIALGLGIGALWVRSATVFLVRQGTLNEYRFLEHGAHYAIGALAVCLFVSLRVEVPELVTGLIGLGFIALALWSSIRRR